MKENSVINARKFDGSIHRSWDCNLLRKDGNLLIFEGVFAKEVIHPDLGIIRPNTKSYEYYWLDRWYNVFRFHEPDGVFRNFYCNLNLPPRFESGILDYTDLDIDVLISNEFEIKILDLDEYEINSKKFDYSEAVKKNVQDSLSELINLARTRQFPFDFVYSQP